MVVVVVVVVAVVGSWDNLGAGAASVDNPEAGKEDNPAVAEQGHKPVVGSCQNRAS